MSYIDTFRLNSNGLYVPFIRTEDRRLHQVAAPPMPDHAFLRAPEKEVGLAGNRGGGRSEALVMDALSGIGADGARRTTVSCFDHRCAK